MALTKCPGCGGSVPTATQACPHCGRLLTPTATQPPVLTPSPSQQEPTAQAAGPTPPTAANPGFQPPQDFDEQLRKVAKLRDEGVLTEDEFSVLKKKILGLGTVANSISSHTESVPSVPLPVSGPVNHSLVWINAFVPIFGIVLDTILVEMGLTMWLGTLIVIGINCLLMTKDEKQLRTQGLPTKELGSAWVVPVYLFKRVQVVGGGYGYAVCWMVTFSINLLR